MPIIRKKLIEAEVYPDDMRYDADTDTVQSFVNGEWVDNPAADPRNQTTLPPRVTDNTECDAAASVTAALHTKIDQIMVAIDNASTLFAIAGIILSIFTLGAFGVFVGLALGIGDQMIGFGSAGISAALTEPVYDLFTCILFCHMDSNGRIEADSLPAIYTDINAQIGGTGALILNAMLHLAGEGGINNLASLGTADGDCSECECGWCYSFEFDGGALGWSSWAQCTTLSSIVAEGWQGQCNSCSYFDTSIEITFSGNLKSISFTMYLDTGGGTPDQGIILNGTQIEGSFAGAGETVHEITGTWSGSQHLQIFANCNCSTFTQIRIVTLRGTGENPFGDDNCE